MKTVLSLVLTLCPCVAGAQTPQSQCEREADAQLTEMWNATSIAGSATYTKLMSRAMACMQSGICSKPEALLHIAEMMVDEQVIDVQRKKVAILKRMAEGLNRTSDICKAAPQIASATNEIVVLNARQFSRIEELVIQLYPAPE